MDKLTMEQAIVISAYTGFLICPFDKLHAEIEQRLGHPIMTHQLIEPNIKQQTKAAFKDDFLAMAPTTVEGR